jgi:hypothetical protein
LACGTFPHEMANKAKKNYHCSQKLDGHDSILWFSWDAAPTKHCQDEFQNWKGEESYIIELFSCLLFEISNIISINISSKLQSYAARRSLHNQNLLRDRNRAFHDHREICQNKASEMQHRSLNGEDTKPPFRASILSKMQDTPIGCHGDAVADFLLNRNQSRQESGRKLNPRIGRMIESRLDRNSNDLDIAKTKRFPEINVATWHLGTKAPDYCGLKDCDISSNLWSPKRASWSLTNFMSVPRIPIWH